MIKEMKNKKLFLMCGIPASGKSTWIQNYKTSIEGNTDVVSRDQIRFSLVKEDEEYFSKEKEVFRTFIDTIKKDIADPCVDNIIVDATHINPRSRAKTLNCIGKDLKGVDVYAVVLKVPLKTCLERNAKREGRACVPVSAIEGMYSVYEDPSIEEGFKEIYFYDENGKMKGVRC